MNILTERANRAIGAYQDANEALKDINKRVEEIKLQLRRATAQQGEVLTEQRRAKEDMVKQIARAAA